MWTTIPFQEASGKELKSDDLGFINYFISIDVSFELAPGGHNQVVPLRSSLNSLNFPVQKER